MNKYDLRCNSANMLPYDDTTRRNDHNNASNQNQTLYPLLPNRAFYNFRASESVDQRILLSENFDGGMKRLSNR